MTNEECVGVGVGDGDGVGEGVSEGEGEGEGVGVGEGEGEGEGEGAGVGVGVGSGASSDLLIPMMDRSSASCRLEKNQCLQRRREEFEEINCNSINLQPKGPTRHKYFDATFLY